MGLSGKSPRALTEWDCYHISFGNLFAVGGYTGDTTGRAVLQQNHRAESRFRDFKINDQ